MKILLTCLFIPCWSDEYPADSGDDTVTAGVTAVDDGATIIGVHANGDTFFGHGHGCAHPVTDWLQGERACPNIVSFYALENEGEKISLFL